jgi:hypothetical protein
MENTMSPEEIQKEIQSLKEKRAWTIRLKYDQRFNSLKERFVWHK